MPRKKTQAPPADPPPQKSGLNVQAHVRRFQLQRVQDASGVSGTGVVAEGVEFTSGLVALTWYSPHRVCSVLESIKTVEELHGHEGRTVVVWLDE